jgi:transposase, IS5 family
VLRETDPQTTLWDALLPEEAKRLPAELVAVDGYPDDERFIAPWRVLFDQRLGRPSVPIDTLLRLLSRKHRYGLGAERLCREVSDSIGWRRFCRIGLDRPVPHPTTLVKLVRRGGPATVEQLNGALLEKLGEDKLLGVGNLRVDTTVVEADIDHPPTPICWSRPSASSVGSPGGSRPAAPPAGPGFGTGRGRRGGDASSSPGPCGGGPGRPKGRLIGSPPRSPPRPADPDPGRAGGPGRPPRAARPTQRRPAWAAGRAAGGDDLGGQAAAGPDRPAPWGEPGDRRSAGCLERPGRPPDPQGQAGPADRVRRHGAAGRARTRLHRHPPHPQGQPARRWPAGGGQHRGDRADRPAAGHGGRRPRVRTAANDQALAALGVTRIGLARTGTPGKARLAWERTRAFRRMRNWRVGIQARSSHLKRSFGLRRTRLGRLGGARTWVGLGIFADNLQRMTVVAG